MEQPSQPPGKTSPPFWTKSKQKKDLFQDGLLYKTDYVRCTALKHSKSQRKIQLHTWFKSYNNFATLVEFAYRWSVIGKGL